MNPNYTDNNHTDVSKHERNQSINLSDEAAEDYDRPIRLSYASMEENDGLIDFEDAADTQKEWTEKIRENVEYARLLIENPGQKNRIDEFIRIMVDVICYGTGQFKIGNYVRPASVVAEKFKRLTFDHLEYVLRSMKGTSTQLKSPDRYIIAALYSAYNTLDNELSQRVNYDLRGVGT